MDLTALPLLPWPALSLGAVGERVVANGEARQLLSLGEQTSIADLEARFDVTSAAGRPVRRPWRRLVSGEEFEDEERWIDRLRSIDLLLRVRGRRWGDGLLLALVDETPHAAAVTEKRLRELSDGALALEAAAPLPELLRELVVRARRLTRTRYAALLTLDDEGKTTEFIHDGVPEDVQAALPMAPAAHGMLGRLATEGASPERIESLQRDPRFTGFPAAHPRIRNLLSAPLRFGGRSFGVFYLAEKLGGESFSDADERLMAIFAAEAGLAVAYARQADVAERRRRELEDALEFQEEFAAVVAHDLRTPIQTLVMQAEILLKHAAGPNVSVGSASLWRMARSGRRLARMVSDLLDFSRLRTGRLALHPSSLSLAEAVHFLVEQLRPVFTRHPLQLSVRAEPPLAFVDLERLDQILVNVLENAARYSNPGSPIRIEVGVEDEGPMIAVEDQGQGIPPEDLPYIFDRFFQGAAGPAARRGLGLGLYITRALVEAHGGTIRAESEVGRGTRFTITFPAAPRAA